MPRKNSVSTKREIKHAMLSLTDLEVAALKKTAFVGSDQQERLAYMRAMKKIKGVIFR